MRAIATLLALAALTTATSSQATAAPAPVVAAPAVHVPVVAAASDGRDDMVASRTHHRGCDGEPCVPPPRPDRPKEAIQQVQAPLQPSKPPAPPPPPPAPLVYNCAHQESQHISNNCNIIYAVVRAHGWGDDQAACTWWIVLHESSGNERAENSIGAYGLGQALPADKMAPYGADYRTNPWTQARWMVNGYIPGRYGTPCGAKSFWVVHNWY